MVILEWGISFHPAVVVGLGNDLLFNSILAHCAQGLPNPGFMQEKLQKGDFLIKDARELKKKGLER